MNKGCYIVLLASCWIVIVISCVCAVSEVKVIPDTSLDPNLKSKDNSNVKTDGVSLEVDPNTAHRVKDGKDQVIGSEKGVVDNNKLKEGSGEQKQISSGKDKTQGKDDGDRKRKPDKGSESEEGSKVVEASSQTSRKEGSRVSVEECDESIRCEIEKIGLVACLRVPGNESPELSLLVQNKGKGPLSVAITGPEFVHLEKTQIQLKENEDNKMKVTIKKAGDSTLIVLTAGVVNCTLDYKNIVAALNLKKETVTATGSTNTVSFFKRTPLIGFIIFGALVVSASGWMCMNCYRKRRFNSSSSNSKYQKLDMGSLPVSGGAEVEFDSNDGWDNNWGDDWDDEEAPKTPLMPLTPSLSSKGLAPRRLNKDVWKD